MLRAEFTFHDKLNDFPGLEKLDVTILYDFDGRPAIKDAIEAIGVPHPEVGLVLINGEAVDFSRGLRDGDTVEVYPHGHALAGQAQLRLPFMPAGTPRFILDVHLGKLARYLRTAGFDTRYSSDDPGDAAIAASAAAEQRIVLTRDVGLLKRSQVEYGYWLRNTESRDQFREVVAHFGLTGDFDLFSRCPHCNGRVSPVDKASVSERLPEGVAADAALDRFVQCEDCGHVYWQGSHYTRMQRFFDTVRRQAGTTG